MAMVMSNGEERPAEFGEVTPEEEAALEAQRRRRNIILATTLAVLTVLLVLATIFSIYITGFRPLDDIDLFRSP